MVLVSARKRAVEQISNKEKAGTEEGPEGEGGGGEKARQSDC